MEEKCILHVSPKTLKIEDEDEILENIDAWIKITWGNETKYLQYNKDMELNIDLNKSFRFMLDDQNFITFEIVDKNEDGEESVAAAVFSLNDAILYGSQKSCIKFSAKDHKICELYVEFNLTKSHSSFDVDDFNSAKSSHSHKIGSYSHQHLEDYTTPVYSHAINPLSVPIHPYDLASETVLTYHPPQPYDSTHIHLKDTEKENEYEDHSQLSLLQTIKYWSLILTYTYLLWMWELAILY